MKLGDEAIEQIETISSGSITLDGALGIGGFPKGRVIEIYGPESSGKTTLAIHAIANAQKNGVDSAHRASGTSTRIGEARRLAWAERDVCAIYVFVLSTMFAHTFLQFRSFGACGIFHRRHRCGFDGGLFLGWKDLVRLCLPNLGRAKNIYRARWAAREPSTPYA